MPKTYDPEFKARAVRLARDHLSDYGSVTAASLAVRASWASRARHCAAGSSRPRSTAASGRGYRRRGRGDRRLKAEVKRLREANEILKAASIFFAGELDSRNR